MHKLYYAPGACSLGIHVLLEEIGAPYATEAVNLRDPPSHRPLTALNPKSQVPTLLRGDGSVLTQWPAIAVWLARANPEAGLLPDDAEGVARALEAIDYSVSTVHMLGFTRVLRPGRFTPSEADYEAVRATGLEIFTKGLGYLDQALAGRDYVVGSFSIADAALFYISFWGANRLKLTLPDNVAGHFARMKERPAVAAVLQKEGFA